MMDVREQFCLFSLRKRILNSRGMKAHIVIASPVVAKVQLDLSKIELQLGIC